MANRVTKITRVRTGCLTCRARKKKCEEQRPICRGCERNGFKCEWPRVSPSPCRSPSALTADNAGEVTGKAPHILSPQSESHDPRQAGQASPTEPQEDPHPFSTPSPPSSETSLIVFDSGSPTCDGAVSDSVEFFLPKFSPRRPHAGSFDGKGPMFALPATLSVFGNGRVWELCGEEGYHLLGHYLTKTSFAMAGGFQRENPFLAQLMPIAMSSDLIMHLILTISAVHKAIIQPTELALSAQTYYRDALTMFRGSIDQYIHHGNSTIVALGLGCLMLCFTEVCLFAA